MLESVKEKAEIKKRLGRPCLVAQFMAGLSGDDRQILQAILDDDETYTAQWIKEQMDEFTSIGYTTWKTHRRGTCSC